MPWKLTEVADIQIPTGHIMPGFNLQQEGHSPSISFVFENRQKAESGRDAMQDLLDDCAAIVHLSR
jgi:hypothetical protein